MNSLIIRLDDISPFINMNRFSIFMKVLGEYNIPAVLGVVPFHLGKEKIEKIAPLLHFLEDKGYEIAQHGYTHDQLSENAGFLGMKKSSEFAGLPFEIQAERINKGKEIMEKAGFSPTTFIPPWHTYDTNTIRALKTEGFRVLNDNYPCWGVDNRFIGGYIRMLQRRPKEINGLVFIPQQYSIPIRYLNLAHLTAILRINYGVVTLCYHLTSLNFLEISRLLDGYSLNVTTCKQLLEESTSNDGKAFS